MIDHFLRYVVPAGYALLPPAMKSPAATSLVLAIGLQESQFQRRRQMGSGTALSFLQFERAGVRGVLVHPRTMPLIEQALRAQCYSGFVREASAWNRILEHHDTLAFVFARCLLWTLPQPLPTREQEALGWSQYLECWRPGKPHPETWAAHWAEAWRRVAPLDA